MADNLQRMLRMVNEFFDTKNDPDQLDVTEEDRAKLLAVHSATMSEYSNDNGPVAWVLIIPTTHPIMARFLSGEIGEKQLLGETPLHTPYDAIYLCSAAVLPEFRRQGIGRRLTLAAIDSIRKDHPIKALFTWSFSSEGAALASELAAACSLPLLERTKQH
jgi:ribosomal protein S18 acetylase RimI-like enzyme